MLSLHRLSVQEVRDYQITMSKKIICRNFLPRDISTVAGVDVSYTEHRCFCVAVVLDYNTLDVIEIKKVSQKVSSPYVPGCFMLRESMPIFSALEKLENKFDVLLIDGNGLLHPRNFGLACHVGFHLDKPTIGVAKKLLCGNIRDDSKVVSKGNKVMGYALSMQTWQSLKNIYISVGHKIALPTAVKIVKSVTKNNQTMPEPIRLADRLSKEFRQSKR